MKPTIGRIVIVRLYQESNGLRNAPAIITRVWSDGDPIDGPVCVNTTAFPDCGPPITMSSVMLHDSEPDLDQTSVCWWPPRE